MCLGVPIFQKDAFSSPGIEKCRFELEFDNYLLLLEFVSGWLAIVINI